MGRKEALVSLGGVGSGVRAGLLEKAKGAWRPLLAFLAGGLFENTNLLKMLVEFNIAQTIEAQQRQSQLIAMALRSSEISVEPPPVAVALADSLIALVESLSPDQSAEIGKLLSQDQMAQLAELMSKAHKSRVGTVASEAPRESPL